MLMTRLQCKGDHTLACVFNLLCCLVPKFSVQFSRVWYPKLEFNTASRVRPPVPRTWNDQYPRCVILEKTQIGFLMTPGLGNTATIMLKYYPPIQEVWRLSTPVGGLENYCTYEMMSTNGTAKPVTSIVKEQKIPEISGQIPIFRGISAQCVRKVVMFTSSGGKIRENPDVWRHFQIKLVEIFEFQR